MAWGDLLEPGVLFWNIADYTRQSTNDERAKLEVGRILGGFRTYKEGIETAKRFEFLSPKDINPSRFDPDVPLPIDLNVDFDEATYKQNEEPPEGPEQNIGSLEPIIQVVYRIANPDAADEDFAVASEDEGDLQKPHIVTYRNNLNKICNSLYNFKGHDLWEMDAVFLDGTTFLDIRKIPTLNGKSSG